MILYIFLLIRTAWCLMNSGNGAFAHPIDELTHSDRFAAGEKDQQSNLFTIMSPANEKQSFDYDYPEIMSRQQEEHFQRNNMRRQFGSMALQPDVAFGDENDRFDLTGIYEEPKPKDRSIRKSALSKLNQNFLDQLDEDLPNYRRDNLKTKNNQLNYRRVDLRTKDGQPNYRRVNLRTKHDQPVPRRSNDVDVLKHDVSFYRRMNNEGESNRRFDVQDVPNYRDQANYGDQIGDQSNYGERRIFRRQPVYRREDDWLDDLMDEVGNTRGDMEIAEEIPQDYRRHVRKRIWNMMQPPPRETPPQEREIVLQYSLPIKIKVRELGNSTFISGISIL